MSKALAAAGKRLAMDLTGTTELADYTDTLEQGQKIRVAGFVIKNGFALSCRALYVNPGELEQLMLDTGHLRCEVCEDWFVAADVESGMCKGEGSCTEEMA